MTQLDLARTQFAVTTSIHWLFVLVTLGLVTAVCYFQTRATLAVKPENRELYFRMTRFWGLMYVINYALGIATGIVMEFQFGTHWSGLSHVVGSVFGAPLAMETIIAFVAESTFLGLWIFGWNKLPRFVHLGLIYATAATAWLSAFWVLVANGFMQNPVGYEMRDGVAVLTDVGAVFGNPSTWLAFMHIIGAAWTVGGFVLLGTSAWHLFRRTEEKFFVRSFRVGYVLAFAGIAWVQSTGYPQLEFVDGIQPGKFAEDRSAFLSVAFEMMRSTADLVAFVLLFALPLVFGRLAARARYVQPLFFLIVPFPFMAAVFGWLFREVGRQPWVVYGLVKTEDAFSGVSLGGMWVSFIGFTAILGALLITDWWLLLRRGLRGPDVDVWQAPAADKPDAPVLLLSQGTR